MKCRNKQSTTLGFVTIAFALVCLSFLFNLMVYHICGAFECKGSGVELIGLGSFGAAISAVLGIWLVREGTEKVKEYKENNRITHGEN